MADADCLRCHQDKGAPGERRPAPCSWTPRELQQSRHAKVACSQCHSGVNASRAPALRDDHDEGRLRRLPRRDRAAVRPQRHGKLLPTATRTPRPARSATGRTGPSAGSRARRRPSPPTSRRSAAAATARARRPRCATGGREHEIIETYTESIHGKGLLEERPHRDRDLHELPHRARRAAAHRPRLEREPRRTCPRPAAGATTASRSSSRSSVHSPDAGARPTRSCPSAPTATARTRSSATDADGFKLDIMDEVRPLPRRDREDATSTPTTARSRQLGYTKTAKCYDCHGAHDILPVDRPALAPLAAERRRDLPEVPPRGEPALRRLPDATPPTTTRRSTRCSSGPSGA